MPVLSLPVVILKPDLNPQNALRSVGSRLPDCWLLTRMFNATLSVVPRKFVPSVPALPVTFHEPVAVSASAGAAMFFQAFPLLYQNELVLMSYTRRP